MRKLAKTVTIDFFTTLEIQQRLAGIQRVLLDGKQLTLGKNRVL